MLIGITGATGQIGGRAARMLAGARPGGAEAADAPRLRLIVRDAARAPQIDGAEVAVASYADPDACLEAFTGLDALLLVSAGEAADRLEQHRTAVTAAAQAGVPHVVYTSFLGASEDAEFTLARDHGATEAMIREAGLRATMLRDSFYADVLVDFAGPDGVIRGPGGDGRCGFVAREDVAAVAAAILVDAEAYAGRVLELTGPEAITLSEAAERMTRVLGRDITYVDETMAEARASRAHYGAPEWELQAWISTYTAIASGALDLVTSDVESVLGRPARTLEQVMEALRR